ncbi:hypothetical protein HCJ76_44030 [Streptomyces sp. MC1]|uniref:hypothetical protein n=1 Tax=Streptomyces sp. MC1 TaxID=295105 RepID=UPI0018CA6F45|nr:hypothetical protein [Streptomyces sp. MC1]MBG7704853.1 hypothetical protein [Streptomyces sp. MC1]
MSPATLQCAEDDDTAVHVVPVGDDIDHDTYSGTCPCGAQTTRIAAADGSEGRFTVHRYVFFELLAAAP